MPTKKQNKKEVTLQKKKDVVFTAERIFDQPSDAISFYCDISQIIATTNEVVVQFYETIPGPPDPDGKIPRVRSRLRSTVTFSLPHASNIGKHLIEKTKKQKK